MTFDFSIKRNDLLPAITATLSDANGAVDLSGASVKFIMTLQGGSSTKVNAAATVVDAAAGQVSYAWSGTDTDTEGIYQAEWQVTKGGKPITFPGDGWLYVQVVKDLG